MTDRDPPGPVPSPGDPGYPRYRQYPPGYPSLHQPAAPSPTPDPRYPPSPIPAAPWTASPGYSSGSGYPARPRNRMGTAALTLGILSIVPGAFIYIGVALGVLAIIFGAVGRARATRGEASNRGNATAGMVLGAVGMVLTGLVAVGYAHLITRVRACERRYATQREIVRCVRNNDRQPAGTGPTSVPVMAADWSALAGPAGRRAASTST